jgi:hypothetical protein
MAPIVLSPQKHLWTMQDRIIDNASTLLVGLADTLRLHLWGMEVRTGMVRCFRLERG